ncbi:SDR family oxidoreductase [Aestuariispira insulae]|uniref:Short-subunit dehydrogenase n=1 Tax=Aestuariispira insulae TaxID=1461337 RepID=A0A3D9HWY7_9PROT|nr:SDR family oxidoreductase [Aestuariispira insulae]RED53929.1 short-subunit dehydrogenase [Aestuariispira insulae]
MAKIENQVALVTGANRGLGKAFVETLLEMGVKKVYAAARSIETLQADFQDDRVVPVRLDVTDHVAINALAADLKDVSLLINNAGIAGFSGFLKPEDIKVARDEMEVNYFAPLMMIRAFASALRENGGGGIINIASIASYFNFPALGSYSASKAATHFLTQGARSELEKQGTHVVGVYPGPIETDMTAAVDMEKTAPAVVARRVLEGFLAGEEDTFPDQASQEMYAGFRADPKAMEKQMSEAMPA